MSYSLRTAALIVKLHKSIVIKSYKTSNNFVKTSRFYKIIKKKSRTRLGSSSPLIKSTWFGNFLQNLGELVARQLRFRKLLGSCLQASYPCMWTSAQNISERGGDGHGNWGQWWSWWLRRVRQSIRMQRRKKIE